VIVAGVDEAGRGPIAGPVVAAAAVLNPRQFRALLREGLNDSKKLSAGKREKIFARMNELGVVWAAQAASHRRIDRTDILRAALWAMRLALEKIPVRADLVVVDGSVFIPGVPREVQRALPRADAKVPAVMAASVAAKVLRDRIMASLHKIYPDYDFISHKGYPTASHRNLLDLLGPSPVHRLTFGGYKKAKMEKRNETRQTNLFAGE
jgi:ribonuclease HII